MQLLAYSRLGALNARQRSDRYGIIGKPKSKAGQRTVPLGPEVVKALKEWKVQCPNNGAHGLVEALADATANREQVAGIAYGTGELRAMIASWSLSNKAADKSEVPQPGCLWRPCIAHKRCRISLGANRQRLAHSPLQ